MIIGSLFIAEEVVKIYYHSMRYFLNSLLDTFRPMLGFHKSVLLMKGRSMYFFFCKLLSIIGEFTFCKVIVRTVDNLDNGRLTSSTFLKGFDFNKAKISCYKILISLFVKNNWKINKDCDFKIFCKYPEMPQSMLI